MIDRWNVVDAVAKESTAKIYLPILFGSNALYVVLLIRQQFPYRSYSSIGCMVLTWGLQLYAYWGILDQAANQTSTTKTKRKELVGGANLDLLALTIIVQYLTVLWSPKWFWILAGVPVYVGWSLYRTIYGIGANSNSDGGKFGFGSSKAYPVVEASDDSDDDKRERRAKTKSRRQRKFA